MRGFWELLSREWFVIFVILSSIGIIHAQDTGRRDESARRAQFVREVLQRQTTKEGTVRLVDGRTPHEGNGLGALLLVLN